LKVLELGVLQLDLQNRKVRNSESTKIFVGEPDYDELIGVRHFRQFRGQEVGSLYSIILEVVKCDTTMEEDASKDFDNSSFQVSNVVEIGSSTTGIAISQNPKSQFDKGRDHIVGQDIWVDS
jgi:hypothetical protein